MEIAGIFLWSFCTRILIYPLHAFTKHLFKIPFNVLLPYRPCAKPCKHLTSFRIPTQFFKIHFRNTSPLIFSSQVIFYTFTLYCVFNKLVRNRLTTLQLQNGGWLWGNKFVPTSKSVTFPSSLIRYLLHFLFLSQTFSLKLHDLMKYRLSQKNNAHVWGERGRQTDFCNMYSSVTHRKASSYWLLSDEWIPKEPSWGCPNGWEVWCRQ